MISRQTTGIRRPSHLILSPFYWIASLRVTIIDHHRGRRIFGLLGVLWLLAGFDLLLTFWAHRFTIFFEENPIARLLLDAGMLKSVAALKLSFLAVASLIFWATRRHRCSEGALWMLALGYVALTFQWSDYTAHADELARYKEMADFAATPSVVQTYRTQVQPAPQTVPQASRDLITLAGSTPVRRISRPW